MGLALSEARKSATSVFFPVLPTMVSAYAKVGAWTLGFSWTGVLPLILSVRLLMVGAAPGPVLGRATTGSVRVLLTQRESSRISAGMRRLTSPSTAQRGTRSTRAAVISAF